MRRNRELGAIRNCRAIYHEDLPTYRHISWAAAVQLCYSECIVEPAKHEPRRLRDLSGTFVRPCSRSKNSEHGGTNRSLVRTAGFFITASCDADTGLWATQMSTPTHSIRLRVDDPCPRCGEHLLARPMRTIFALFRKREFLQCPRCSFALMTN